ncbi:TPA: hypothetical protein ACH3X3_004508 [Trebouxia sp. C0006]
MSSKISFSNAQCGRCPALPQPQLRILCVGSLVNRKTPTACGFMSHKKRKTLSMASSEVGFETATAPPPPVNDGERLKRAKGYPYPRPDSSFVYINGQTYEFDDSQWLGAGGLEWLKTDTLQGHLSIAQVLKNHNTEWKLTKEAKLTPVLAVGSNAAPAQLARKFPAELFPDGVVIPVLRCVLPDFDVVYAPLISSYGSCTATLEYSPGSAVAIFVTYLQPNLLQRMHETEGAYNLCELTEVQLQIGLGLQDYRKGKVGRQIISTIYQYNHQNGSLNLPVEGFPQNVPIAIKEIKAVDRVFPALDQVEMQLACKHVLEPVLTADDEEATTPSPAPLQMADSQTPPTAATGEANGTSSNGATSNGAQFKDHQEWSQDRGGLDKWILTNLNDGQRRLKMVKALTNLAKPFQYGASTVKQALGDLYFENVS